MRCVTLMVNRSDRRFPTLSAAMAREAARLISRTKRAEVHQGPGPHLTPDKQAGYMTATEFQNRVCNSTLARGRGPYMSCYSVILHNLDSEKLANFLPHMTSDDLP